MLETASAPHDVVYVELGSRSYDIIIGTEVLSNLAHHLGPIVGQGRIHIITDETVYGLHGDKLAALDTNFTLDILPPGEDQKCFETLQRVLHNMFTAELGRNDTVIAFGGGVIGDLTGFAASIYKRGCQFVQIPTTLLSQVDSSVGGKTAINVTQGKNLVGAFYQPKIVLTDISVLSTLPERQLKAGYAEVLKYGLLGDSEFYDWLEVNGSDILAGDPTAMTSAIAVSCKTKARIVAADETERGQRALLNLGHTFGHALEAEAGYDGDLLHGEAVSAGMMMAFDYSVQEGLCPRQDSDRLSRHLETVGLTRPENLPHLFAHPENLLRHMNQDKKNEGGDLTLVLTHKIGDAFVKKRASRPTVETYLNTLSQRVRHA